MRLIDADALKETIDREIFRHDTIDHVFQIIDDAPTIEPKRGEWFMGDRPLEGKFRIFRCSVCGYEPFYKGEPITPTNMTLRYCPNCGARMKGADDE